MSLIRLKFNFNVLSNQIVIGEEAAANEKAAEAKAIKDECEAELSVAMPMLESAIQALNTLTKADITEVKAMKNPPAVVKLVMEAVCIMKQIKPRRINDPNNPVKKIDDFWEPSQKLLNDSGFLQSLEVRKPTCFPSQLTNCREAGIGSCKQQRYAKDVIIVTYIYINWCRV